MKPSKPTFIRTFVPVIFLLTCFFFSCNNPKDSGTIQLTFSAEHYKEALDGRLIVLISEQIETEPRFQLRDDSKTCQGFGMDVNDWKPGESLQFDMQAFGYPIEDFKDLLAGEYFVQVLFHKYETFNRADGHVVKLPMDRGE